MKGMLREIFRDRKKPTEEEVKESTQDAFLELIMCPPKYLSTKINNNAWMRDLSGKEKKIDVDKAMAQFFDLYGVLAQDAMVYLLPPKKGLQDEVYISNAGMVLPHLKEKTMILSNFTAEGRPGEEKVLSDFATLMGFKQFPSPFKFEGEAEMKWLRDNIYICGYGMRSDIKAFQWMEEKFGCKNIYVKERDDLRYHLDCSVFCIDKETVLLAKDSMTAEEVKAIEAVADIIPVSRKDAQFSLTNSVRVGSVIYNASAISEMEKDDAEYAAEKHKNEALEKICRDKGLSLVWGNLSEMAKSGAALSCCVLHASYIGYPA